MRRSRDLCSSSSGPAVARMIAVAPAVSIVEPTLKSQYLCWAISREAVANGQIISIENAIIEDESTIEKMLTMTRLLAIGLFAFAAKKKEKTELHYLTITWKFGKFDNETIFEFDGVNSAQFANTRRNNIISAVNAIGS